MAETAPQTHYMGSKRKKPKKTAMSGYGGGKKKAKYKTGGTKHVVASEGGSL